MKVLIAKAAPATAADVHTGRRTVALIALSLCCAVCSAPTYGRDVVHGHGVLWQVERPGYWPSFVFGTMHSDDSRVLHLPLPVRAHFNRADSVVVEADTGLGRPARRDSVRAMVYTDGQRLSQVVGPSLYHRALAAMQRSGYPESLVALMKPWAVSTLLTFPRPMTGMILDTYLVAEAQRQGKPVQGLETMEEQLLALETLSLADQKVMLAEALDQLPRRSALHERLTQAYLDRDLQRLIRIGYETLDGESTGNRFTENLIDRRNVRMVERMEPLLRRGRVFFAVGALHLPGDRGILALLERHGYRVTPLY